MSGELGKMIFFIWMQNGFLARPNVSIPRGTLQAVFTTFLTYVLTAFLLCLSCSRELLQGDYMVSVINFGMIFLAWLILF